MLQQPRLKPFTLCCIPGTYEPRFYLNTHCYPCGPARRELLGICHALGSSSSHFPFKIVIYPTEATDLNIKVWNAQDTHQRPQLSLLFQRSNPRGPEAPFHPCSSWNSTNFSPVSEIRFHLSQLWPWPSLDGSEVDPVCLEAPRPQQGWEC